MKTIIILFGTCLTFVPLIIFVTYLFKSIKEKTKFSYHLTKVKDKKGTIGVINAYFCRILAAITITAIGIYLSTYFTSHYFLKIAFLSSILTIISGYLDNKFDSY